MEEKVESDLESLGLIWSMLCNSIRIFVSKGNSCFPAILELCHINNNTDAGQNE